MKQKKFIENNFQPELLSHDQMNVDGGEDEDSNRFSFRNNISTISPS